MHRYGSKSLAAIAAAAAIVSLSACASIGGGGEVDGELGPDATATLRTPDGQVVGQVDLRDTPLDAVLMRVTLFGGVIQPGAHGFHVHETGRCEPDFGAAGEHYDPDGREHGILNPEGRHAGDLPNIHFENTGRTEFEILAYGLTTRAGAAGTLLGDGGTAFVVHGGADDYRSQPSGEAGDPVACGVIRER